jgi:hypothetical protein
VPEISQRRAERLLRYHQGNEDAPAFMRSVRGEFCDDDIEQLISQETIAMATARQRALEPKARLIIGCDIAGTGPNETVFVVRQGPHILEVHRYRRKGLDEVSLALMTLIDRYQFCNPLVYCDADGIGMSVVHNCMGGRLRPGKRYRIEKVNSGGTAYADDRFSNRRAELMCRANDWLYSEGCLDASAPYYDALVDQLTDIYSYEDNHRRIQIERKQDLRARGKESPDIADALAYTFLQNSSVLRVAFVSG